jgi:hypothetical protein
MASSRLVKSRSHLLRASILALISIALLEGLGMRMLVWIRIRSAMLAPRVTPETMNWIRASLPGAPPSAPKLSDETTTLATR